MLSSQDDSVIVTIPEMVIVILNNDTMNILISDLSKEVNETNETINTMLAGFSKIDIALSIFSAMFVLTVLSVILVTWHWCRKR